jgi:hypothetical protein
VLTDLLCAAYTVVSGYNVFTPQELMQEIMPEEEKKHRLLPLYHHFENDIHWLFAARLVAEVYGNQAFENAICRYHTAHEIIDLHPMDLHPSEDSYHEEYSLTEQIRIANLIIVCQSVLEEIGFSITLRKNHSLVDDSTWSEEAIEKCNEILSDKGVDNTKSIPWLYRMGLSASAENNVLDKSHLCEWSKGIIHDYEINIVDGILELKRLRNRIGAHALDNRVLKLSIYDAENAFSLTRTILLDCFRINVLEKFPMLAIRS